MNSRERVLTALKHQEPDRVPLDLGCLVTTIETVPYNNLKEHLGIELQTRTFVRDHIDGDGIRTDLAHFLRSLNPL